MKIGHLPDQGPCPRCGKVLDGWGVACGRAGHPPTVGDYTICTYCFELLRFAPGDCFAVVADAEIEAMDPDLITGLVLAKAFAVGMRTIQQREKARFN